MNIDIISLQNKDAFKEASPERKAELVKLMVVSHAFQKWTDSESTKYENSETAEGVKAHCNKIAVDAVDEFNELYPLDFEATVDFVCDALYKRHLLYLGDAVSADRLQAICSLVGIDCGNVKDLLA